MYSSWLKTIAINNGVIICWSILYLEFLSVNFIQLFRVKQFSLILTHWRVKLSGIRQVKK
jgi:hypothetical protein